MRSHTCPKCQSSMAEGFVIDVNQSGAHTVSTWFEGAPERAWYGGIKTRGKPQFKIQSWRCNRCGFLEQYARD